jgi:transposase
VERIEPEAKLDGIYLIRTSERAEQLSAAATVRGYKSLAQVERAFRSLKGLDLLIRPIRHRTEERVLAHIFLCMLAGVASAAGVGTSAV